MLLVASISFVCLLSQTTRLYGRKFSLLYQQTFFFFFLELKIFLTSNFWQKLGLSKKNKKQNIKKSNDKIRPSIFWKFWIFYPLESSSIFRDQLSFGAQHYFDLCWTVHHCDNWRIKNQLDATYYFIVLLIGSTCFGHYYAHHQELATIILVNINSCEPFSKRTLRSPRLKDHNY